jgi:hypothetical protein
MLLYLEIELFPHPLLFVHLLPRLSPPCFILGPNDDHSENIPLFPVSQEFSLLGSFSAPQFIGGLGFWGNGVIL